MNRLLFFVALVAVAATTTALAIAPATVAMAQVVPATPAIEEISGTYVNEEAGLEITLPDGWAGFAVPPVNGATSVMAAPDALTEEAQADIMILSIVEKTSMDEDTVPEASQRPGVPEDQEAQCEEPQIEQVQVNGMEGVVMETECTTEGDTYRSKMYSFQTEERFYIVAYAANSEGDYDGNVGAFDSSVNTLTIENTIEAPAIPEFPLAAIGAIAAAIGTIAVLGRTRFMRGGSGMT